MSTNPFVITLMVLNIGAAVWEAWNHRYYGMVYWFSAFALTFCVTRMGK